MRLFYPPLAPALLIRARGRPRLDQLNQGAVVEIAPAAPDHLVPKPEAKSRGRQLQVHSLCERQGLRHILALDPRAAARLECASDHTLAMHLKNAGLGEAAAHCLPHPGGIDPRSEE